MQTLVKQELHKLVDNCEDESLLLEAKNLMAPADKDCWNELSDTDKELLRNSELEYEAGDYITHKELMQQLKEMQH